VIIDWQVCSQEEEFDMVWLQWPSSATKFFKYVVWF